MKIIVITPIHNGSATLTRALDSVWAQTSDAEVEVLCLDDASTDDSREVLAGLAANEPRIRVHHNPTNLGVSATRNLAITMTTEPLIAFLDQDDEWVPDKLERQLAVLRARPEIGYVVGRQRFIQDGANRPAWTREEWFDEPQTGYVPSSLIVRRSTFDQIGTFDESMRFGGDDTDWFARARREGIPYVHLEDAVLNRYVHGRNLSSNSGTSDELLKLVRRHVAENRHPS